MQHRIERRDFDAESEESEGQLIGRDLCRYLEMIRTRLAMEEITIHSQYE